jgi:hypothetical protein
MNERLLKGTRFRPLGRRGYFGLTVSRRAFVGGGILAPLGLLGGHSVQARTGASPPESGRFAELRFVEDPDGISVIGHNKVDSDSGDFNWRLRRAGLGRDCRFVLRTLRGGKEAGYELEVSGVRFGALVGRRHLLVFINRAGRWRVRMRSDLWARNGQELTSSDVDIRALCEGYAHKSLSGAPAATKCEETHEGSFRFRARGEDLRESLDAVFEGHLRASGEFSLELDADFVWHLDPRTGGRFVLMPFGFQLGALEVAWCESAAGPADHCRPFAQGLLPTARRTKNTERPDDTPVLCAASTIVNPAPAVRFSADRELQGKLGVCGDLTFEYLRQDWDWKPGRWIPGLARVTGKWLLETTYGSRVTLSSIDIARGSFESRFDSPSPARAVETAFAGVLRPDPIAVHSRIGQLQIKGWATEPTSDLTGVLIKLKYPRNPPERAIAQASSVDIPFLLLESDLAPEGTEFSRLTFKPTLVHAFFNPSRAGSVQTVQRAGSYLWLGDPRKLAGCPLARLDLSRARLEVSRSADLAQLAFMFADLNLYVDPGNIRIYPASESCRTINRTTLSASTSPQLLDSRPVLVVEFPPQHWFEEVLFRPGGADLPEVDLQQKEFPVQVSDPSVSVGEQAGKPVSFPTNPEKLLKRLDDYPNPKDRATIRRALRKLKVEAEAAAPRGTGSTKSPLPFDRLNETVFSDYFESSGGNAPTVDQKVYIGPYGMDADVTACAREALQKLYDEKLEVIFQRSLDDADQLVGKVIRLDPPELDSSPDSFLVAVGRVIAQFFGIDAKKRLNSAEYALAAEIGVAGVLPDYAFFRDFYRVTMTNLFMTGSLGDLNGDGNIGSTKVDPKLLPPNSSSQEIEYYSKSNRDWVKDGSLRARLESHETDVKKAYLQVLKGLDLIPPRTRIRLANPSRLAFRVGCGTPHFEGRPSREERKLQGSIGFSFESLTDWTQHELAVTPRARTGVNSDESGRPAIDAGRPKADGSQGTSAPKAQGGGGATGSTAPDTRVPPTDDEAMLEQLGIRAGPFVTAQERLTDVEASLREPPGPLETAIEMPARLILSPSQRAFWRTPGPGVRLQETTAATCHRSTLHDRKDGHPCSNPIQLWSAELSVENPAPVVRAVHSPDLRPGFVRRGIERALAKASDTKPDAGSKFKTASVAAPPRGPRAPWTLGIEEGDPSASPVQAVYETVRDASGLPRLEGETACPPDKTAPTGAQRHPLVRYLCKHGDELSNYGRLGLFRSSLDAYDRHELVLLTSAWGLPVRGRREQNGQLVATSTSSQVEPKSTLQPIDLESGSALYRPRPLKLQELRLTALGGTIRHNTDFVPPTAARHIVYGALYDSLSIERWQHWAVMGRDVFAEVVYKGFLFPLGHRASLVKQTERVFLRAPTANGNDGAQTENKKLGSVRAYLRQRMFIRVGEPDKVFPALGQPNLGRQFPAGRLRILTKTTPDIVDPTQDAGEFTAAPAPGGRVLGKMPGLVFWPRTARVTGAEVRFEAMFENAFVDLPLLFVDNTAAKAPDVLKAVVAYYNGIASPDPTNNELESIKPELHLRTIDFGGQAHRYCDELRPGSATHKTLAWTLSASGGSGSHDRPPQGVLTVDSGLRWDGSNDKFDDPSLEAADQPSFYPAVETARIRMDQVERLTAGKQVVALVQFDGYFVANGLSNGAGTSDNKPTSGTAQGKDPFNPLEIYLDILNQVELGMGSAGDRSGALLRPSSKLVALCRQRGPVAGLEPLNSNSYAPKGSRVLATVVNRYSEAAPENAAKGDESPMHKVYAQYFADPALRSGNKSGPPTGPDTKLLGILPIRDLLKLMNLKPIDHGAPALQEVVQYGIAGVEKAADAIRSRVVAPLQKTVEALRAQWQALNEKLKGRQTKVIGQATALSLSDIFPEIDNSLRDLSTSLGKSVQAAEGAEFYTSLAEVYESGHRLVDALGRASANPIERAYVAVVQRLQGSLDQFGKISDVLDPVLTPFKTDPYAAVGDALVEALTDDAGLVRFFDYVDDLDKARQKGRAAIDSFRESVAKPLRSALRAILGGADASAALDGFRGAMDWADVPELPPDGLEPVLKAVQSMATALKPNPPDWGLMAGAAANLIGILATTPQGLSLGDTTSGLGSLFEKLGDALKATEVRVANLEKLPTMITIPAAAGDTVDVPQEFAQLVDATLAGRMSAFALTCKQIVDQTRDLEPKVRGAIVAAGNAAVKWVFDVRDRARVLSDARAELARQYGKFPQLNFELAFNAVSARSALLGSVDSAVQILLPDENQVATLKDELNKKLGALVSKALVVVQDVRLAALSAAAGWIDKWVQLTEGASDFRSRQAQTVRNSNEDIVRAAKQRIDETATWASCIVSRATLNPKLETLPWEPSDASVSAVLASFDQLMTDKFRQWWRAVVAIGSKAAEYASIGAGKLAEVALLPAYESLVKYRHKLLNSAGDASDSLLPLLLVRPESGPDKIYADITSGTLSGSSETGDQLHWDLVSLQLLSSEWRDLKKQNRQGEFLSDGKRYKYLEDFLQRWQTGKSSPQQIVIQLGKLSLEDARAWLLGAVDFSSLREAIDDQIKQLIPLSASLSYEFQSTFNSGGDGVFVPQKDCQLKIQSHSSINFLTGNASFTSSGNLGPFNIRLVGKDFDAVTIMFDGATFQSDGGPLKCDVKYRDFKIGPELAFLSQLAAVFQPKQGSGFYLVPLSSGIGIEAGYGLNIGTISFGTLSFFNVSLNAAARLPFDGQSATFVSSISRRDSPFTISVAPYGGSGFFAIESNGKEIVGFEASFEYGGAAAFQYGPLSGQGRLMTGVYVRRKANVTDISATFYAGGSASIWIFTFGASLYVCARMSGTSMVGDATFTFSFSMGLVDFDYRVNVHKEIDWAHDKKDQQRGKPDNGRNLPGAVPDSSALFAAADATRAEEIPELRIDSWCQGEDWARHKDHFDLGLDIEIDTFA